MKPLNGRGQDTTWPCAIKDDLADNDPFMTKIKKIVPLWKKTKLTMILLIASALMVNRASAQ
jgi:hypothetical protein